MKYLNTASRGNLPTWVEVDCNSLCRPGKRINLTAHKHEPIFPYVSRISYTLPTGEEAKTDLVDVWSQNTSVMGCQPALLYRVCVVIPQPCDGYSCDYTLLFDSTAVEGAWNNVNMEFVSGSWTDNFEEFIVAV